MTTATRIDFFFKFKDPDGGFATVDAGSRIEVQQQRLAAAGQLTELKNPRALFTRDPSMLLQDQQRLEGTGATGLADLTTWFRGSSLHPATPDLCAAQLHNLKNIDIVHQTRFIGRTGVMTALQHHSRRLRSVVTSATRRVTARVRPVPLPDQSRRQRHLLSGTSGVGVVDLPGWPHMMTGADITIGVIDDYWYKQHPCLNNLDVVTESGECGHVHNHGTEVIGVLLAPADAVGIVGIAPGARLVFAYPYARAADGQLIYSVADAIDRATALLKAGDVLLIERQLSFLPVEIVPTCRHAIAYAIAKGIHVVEPAGNGGKNLDALHTPDWQNALSRANDSGAIMVGAAVDASPVRGRRHAPLTLSNSGERIDVQAWGAGVLTTTGHDPDITDTGDTEGNDSDTSESTEASDDPPGSTGGNANNEGYGQFGGTSAASAMIAGVTAVASAIARKLDPNGGTLSPTTLRQLLIRGGAHQHPATMSRHIGPLPVLPRVARQVREHLYQQHGIKVPAGPAPDLSPMEAWALQLVASGLSEAQAGTEMRMNNTQTSETFATLREKVNADTILELARAADHWGFA